MSPFNRLPGKHGSPAGLEWTVLKNLPRVFLYGTLLLCAFWAGIEFGAFALDNKSALIAQYTILGTVLFHWMCCIGCGVYCVIIWLMKGPAYVMDAYYLPEQLQG